MPLPGENPLQPRPMQPGGVGAPAPPQQPQQPADPYGGVAPGVRTTPPGQKPIPQPVDSYGSMIDVLSKQINRNNERLEKDRQTLADQERQSFEERQRTLEPIRKSISGAIDDMRSQIGSPEPPALPAWNPGPIVNSEDYQKFGFMALAMALIGGIASKGDWYGAVTSLNGALHGYQQGSVDLAKKNWQDFQEQYQEARDDFQMKLNRYKAIMDDRQLSINGMFTQYQLAADRFGDDMMKFTLQQKDLDNAQKHIDTLERMLWQAELAHMRVNMQMGAAISGADRGGIAMAATGMPFTAIWSGLAATAFNFRNEKLRETIAYIQEQEALRGNPISEEQAGVILAQRRAVYAAGAKSVSQQTLQQGATEGVLKVLDYNLDMAQQEIDILGAQGITDLSPVFNAIARGAEEVSGQPAYTRLLGYTLYSMQESARIGSGGAASAAQTHQGAMDQAREWLSMKWTTPKMFKEGVVPFLKMEARNRSGAYTQEIGTQLQRMVSEPLTKAPMAPYQPPAGVPFDPSVPGVVAPITPGITPDMLDDARYGQ